MPTNILAKILPNHSDVQRLHSAIENKPFLKRYMSKNLADQVTLLDHYRHLRQLRCIYDAFTEILTSNAFTPKLPDNLACLLKRGEQIQKDLDFLSEYVKDENKDVELESTKKYVQHLKQIHLEAGNPQNNELLMHFLILTLGDLNGGRFISYAVKGLYMSKIPSIMEQLKDNPNLGRAFYDFGKDPTVIGDELTAWLKTFIPFKEISPDQAGKESESSSTENTASAIQNIGVEALCNGAEEAFKRLTDIINELEKTRPPIAQLAAANTSTSVASSSSSLFNQRNLATAAAVGALAVAGAVIANRFRS